VILWLHNLCRASILSLSYYYVYILYFYYMLLTYYMKKREVIWSPRSSTWIMDLPALRSIPFLHGNGSASVGESMFATWHTNGLARTDSVMTPPSWLAYGQRGARWCWHGTVTGTTTQRSIGRGTVQSDAVGYTRENVRQHPGVQSSAYHVTTQRQKLEKQNNKLIIFIIIN